MFVNCFVSDDRRINYRCCCCCCCCYVVVFVVKRTSRAVLVWRQQRSLRRWLAIYRLAATGDGRFACVGIIIIIKISVRRHGTKAWAVTRRDGFVFVQILSAPRRMRRFCNYFFFFYLHCFGRWNCSDIIFSKEIFWRLDGDGPLWSKSFFSKFVYSSSYDPKLKKKKI